MAHPTGLAIVGDAVWVSDDATGDLVAIAPPYEKVARRVHVGDRLAGIASADGMLFVAVRPSRQTHRGGTLTVIPPEGFSIDPAFNYMAGWGGFEQVYDGLVTFRRVGGVDGRQVVADLADKVPRPNRRRPDVRLPSPPEHRLLGR